MRLLLGLILFVLFRIAHPLQCLQCVHNQDNPDVDCINADVKYLKDCTNNDALQQVTEWDCYVFGYYTTSTVLFVYRQCIARSYENMCTFGGGQEWAHMQCICNNRDGCNDNVPPLRNATLSPTEPRPSTPSFSTPWAPPLLSTPWPSTPFETTSPGPNGSINLRLSPKFVVYVLIGLALRFMLSR